MSNDTAGCLVVLTNTPGRSATIGAQWLAAADLADAFGRRLGGAEILTPMGLLTPDRRVQPEPVANAVPLGGT